MEIERKFLVKREDAERLIGAMGFLGLKGKTIHQHYLSFEPEVRTRHVLEDGKTFLTIKSDGDLIRQEFERPISTAVYNELVQGGWVGEYINKTRYSIIVEGAPKPAELDAFHKWSYRDVYIVEVEFYSEKSANAFQPPDWFGEEVTYDKRFKNKSIAQGSLNDYAERIN